MITPSEEIELAHHIRALKELLNLKKEERTRKQLRRIRMGKQTRDRILATNLRLVESIAKNHQHGGLELFDLIQEGSVGHSHAVDKFDHLLGYKFSTSSYWWIRRSIARTLDNQSRLIHLPSHTTAKLFKVRTVTLELTNHLNSPPNRVKLAHAIRIKHRDLEELIAQSYAYCSLDSHIHGGENCGTLGELIPDSNGNEPIERLELSIQKEHLGGWLFQLTDRDQQIL